MVYIYNYRKCQIKQRNSQKAKLFKKKLKKNIKQCTFEKPKQKLTLKNPTIL